MEYLDETGWQFSGQLDWRLELENINFAKSHILSFSQLAKFVIWDNRNITWNVKNRYRLKKDQYKMHLLTSYNHSEQEFKRAEVENKNIVYLWFFMHTLYSTHPESSMLH